ncbi:MAG: DNA-directed RNA polymerase subunit beta [Candidatus Melainabacteria bacterium RIFOXYA12_FULL_32_12]|nr:MAG: DNA-directed RNA polymerase subunit beta [Candidatus Melainabacteria bacterium GWF2_32_7]OGI23127.1 MAG: DNA-directed RNA polymerase subunit beta [Candidatus Melainabacteria bacterium RIFOXYA2_FULL_32_9]OGI30339.1 MAG: DNA-directed RNA polymerase subunit beta [Candidatus Melainabacteria bacterium RIFOXYA12_FULL_32_12]
MAELPDLTEIQKNSFEWFLKEGLKEELLSFSPIKDYTGRLELHFLPNYTFDNPKYTVEEARIHDASYTKQLRVMMKLVNRDTGEIKEQEVYVGDIPMMTEKGTFIINGAERVIVSQIVRSPGIYYKRDIAPTGKRLYNATLIPNRGAWLKIETDINDIVYVKIDKNRKILATTLLKALGISVSEMETIFRHSEFLRKTLDKDTTKNTDEALIEVYKKLRPGDPASASGGRSIIESRFFDEKRYDLGKVGRYKLNKKLGLNLPETQRTLTVQDIVASIEYLINLTFDEGNVDDIDHLGNRRIRSVGELLQNQFRIGLTRLERIVKERMTLQDTETLTPTSLLNTKPLVAAIKEFFGSSQLSQFMDQTNPLAELTHKRRLSALGPGGLARERAGFAVRDIHPSHYGRICPVETPEGPNAGLIGSLSTFARVNEYGFIETPYLSVRDNKVTEEVHYLSADEEDNFRVAPGDITLNPDRSISTELVPIRYRSEFTMGESSKVDYVGVSPIQIISVGTALIPFLEHDDANRALMGSNMQRQAVPLLRAQRPMVGTGIEKRAATDSGMVIVAQQDGVIERVTGDEIQIKDTAGRIHKYTLMKYVRSNQDTCLNQKPVAKAGQKVQKGDVIADGAATEFGELALGRNVLVAFMPWEGYNFEDAILISDRLVHDDVFTSIHIEKLEIDARTTKLGPEEITREVPNVSEDSLRHLDERGIVRIGARVYADDILVGKVTPKGESEHPPEEKLLRAIFAEKARDVRDNSLRVPHGEGGRVVDVKVFDREKGDELPPGANTVIRVYIAQKRKISVGDKMAGRHGNKGIISKILPKEDMPFLPDGTAVDLVLNPLGVPSRMNVGQTYETLLGLAAFLTGKYYEVPPFDEMFGEEASGVATTKEIIEGIEKTNLNWVQEDGKVTLYDGRTGESFDQPVSVGMIYLMKLVHLVDDKIHARSTGPYSLVTQQPLGGKAQFGGQRFGEMEVWALEAYGAAYTLQEMLTIKSDDVNGRSRAYEAIVKGENLQRPGIPESFKVLVRELQSIGLDITVAKRGGLEVDLMSDTDDIRKSAPKRTLSDLDSELLNINFFQTPGAFTD